jgi:hypothetical protein
VTDQSTGRITDESLQLGLQHLESLALVFSWEQLRLMLRVNPALVRMNWEPLARLVEGGTLTSLNALTSN